MRDSKTLLVVPVLLLVGAVVGAQPPKGYDHWAWKKPSRPAVPPARESASTADPIDAFVAARREVDGLRQPVRASREALLRRVSLDLIGLPPTLSEIDAFLEDGRPDAWERVVDRLLSSPAYGERWGRHWLDLVRYAESNGYEHDEVRPNAWRYRDWVIRAFNADLPYDRFIRQQLAGDETEPDNPDALVATGFNLLGPDMTDSADQPQRRQNTLDDMTDTTGLVFLGLTITCARCHDHKFEPLTQRDYFALQAFFSPAQFRNDLVLADARRRQEFERGQQDYRRRIAPMEAEIAKIEAPYRKRLHEQKLSRLADEARLAHQTPTEKRTPAQQALVEKTARLLGITPAEVTKALSKADLQQRRELLDQIRRLDRCRPSPLPVALGLRDGPAARTFILERGDRTSPGTEVQPGFPAVLSGGKETAAPIVSPRRDTTGRRSTLAAWITSKDNPLTARVIVNRIWQHHFGQGLIRTPSDLGTHGSAPADPALLDWLAVEFMESGLSIKRLHRLILTSAAYQETQSGKVRLEGETIRDSLLAISGRLDRTMGGPGVFPPLPEEAARVVKTWKPSADSRDHVRRSVYIFAGRNLRFPFLEAFDAPDSNLSCPKRERSTTAPQALALLNADDVMVAARALADRVSREEPTLEGRIERMYRLTLGRRPLAGEIDLARTFLKSSPLSELGRALFNLNEFVYPD